MPKGRPSVDIKWNESVKTQVLDDLESGMTLREAAERSGISASLIIWKATRDDEFAKQYARVIAIRTDRDFESLEDDLKVEPPTVSTKYGEYVDAGWVAWKRLQVDTRKWALSKRNPKKYGEKLNLEGDLNIKTVLVPAAAKSDAERPARKPDFDETSEK